MEQQQRRTPTEIIVDILKIAALSQSNSKQATKTALVYKTNLNFKRLTRYLDLLLENKLITSLEREYDGATVYMTTEKGLEALEMMSKVQAIIFGSNKRNELAQETFNF